MAKRSILINAKPQAFANLDIVSSDDYSELSIVAPNGKAIVSLKVSDGKFVVSAHQNVAAPKPPKEEPKEEVEEVDAS